MLQVVTSAARSLAWDYLNSCQLHASPLCHVWDLVGLHLHPNPVDTATFAATLFIEEKITMANEEAAIWDLYQLGCKVHALFPLSYFRFCIFAAVGCIWCQEFDKIMSWCVPNSNPGIRFLYAVRTVADFGQALLAGRYYHILFTLSMRIYTLFKLSRREIFNLNMPPFLIKIMRVAEAAFQAISTSVSLYYPSLASKTMEEVAATLNFWGSFEELKEICFISSSQHFVPVLGSIQGINFVFSKCVPKLLGTKQLSFATGQRFFLNIVLGFVKPYEVTALIRAALQGIVLINQVRLQNP